MGHFELIIQDNISLDKTLCLVEKYKNKLPYLSISSEKDSGIYDAWNKALARANGEWIIFLGADDYFYDKTVLEKTHTKAISISEEYLFLAGIGRQVTKDKEAIEIIHPYLGEYNSETKRWFPAHNPSLFYNKKLFEKNKYNPDWKIAGDYEFIVRNWNPKKVLGLDFYITDMTVGGISTSANTRLAAMIEVFQIHRKEYKTISFYLLWAVLKCAFHTFLIYLWGDCKANKIYDFLRRLKGKAAYWTIK